MPQKGPQRPFNSYPSVPVNQEPCDISSLDGTETVDSHPTPTTTDPRGHEGALAFRQGIRGGRFSGGNPLASPLRLTGFSPD